MISPTPPPAPATATAGNASENAPENPTVRPTVRKVCILTGGGDAPGVNAVVRGFVKRALQSGIESWGSEDGFEGLIAQSPSGGRVRPLGLADVRGVLPRGGSFLGCSNRSNPFAMAIAPGSRETRDASDHVLARIREHAFDALVLVGGDGTMHYARRFGALGVPCIGIPKTIDNDLAHTDQTFGFETAVNTATWAIDALHSTAEAHGRVMIVEVMGRSAGWIALWAGIAGGADVILVPEIPYDVERVVAKIRAREAKGARFSIVVAAEGARPIGGEPCYVEVQARPGQLRRLGGSGEALARALQGRVDHEVRVTVLGHLQRGGSPSAFDRLLGTRMGVHAADMCAAGAFGRMVTLEGTKISSIALNDVEDAARLVDRHGQLCHAARATGIELGEPG